MRNSVLEFRRRPLRKTSITKFYDKSPRTIASVLRDILSARVSAFGVEYRVRSIVSSNRKRSPRSRAVTTRTRATPLRKNSKKKTVIASIPTASIFFPQLPPLRRSRPVFVFRTSLPITRTKQTFARSMGTRDISCRSSFRVHGTVQKIITRRLYNVIPRRTISTEKSISARNFVPAFIRNANEHRYRGLRESDRPIFIDADRLPLRSGKASLDEVFTSRITKQEENFQRRVTRNEIGSGRLRIVAANARRVFESSEDTRGDSSSFVFSTRLVSTSEKFRIYETSHRFSKRAVSSNPRRTRNGSGVISRGVRATPLARASSFQLARGIGARRGPTRFQEPRRHPRLSTGAARFKRSNATRGCEGCGNRESRVSEKGRFEGGMFSF